MSPRSRDRKRFAAIVPFEGEIDAPGLVASEAGHR
jgi:hypothetical protein